MFSEPEGKWKKNYMLKMNSEMFFKDIIKYPQNSTIISYKLFTDLIGISVKDKELLNKIIDLNNNKDLEILKALYNYDSLSNNT